MGYQKMHSHAAHGNQYDGQYHQNTDDQQHDDGEDALDDPALYRQALVGHIVGIHVAESVEKRHDATGAENQAKDNTDREQAFVWLVHDAIDGIGNIVKRSRWDEEILDQHHYPLIKMRDRDVGNQGEEEKQQREKCHKEIEGHAGGTIDGTAFCEKLDEIANHIEQWELGSWEMHNLQKIVILFVPGTQRIIFSLDPCHNICKIKKKVTLQTKIHPMSEETISHEGVITKITDDTLEIKITALSACAACHAKSACTMSDQAEKILTVPRPEDQEFHLFQKVNVTMTVAQGNKAAVLAYLVPIVLLLAVLFICLGLGLGEGLSAIISIVALIPYYIVLYLRRDKIKRQFEYRIE